MSRRSRWAGRYQATGLSWTGEGCDPSAPATLAQAAIVTGTFDPAFGDPWVVGCQAESVPLGSFGSRVDASGRFRMEVAAGPCRVRAQRRDGTLAVHGAWVPVTPRRGDPTQVDLVLPDVRQGGLGIWTEVAPNGVAVERVLTDGPHRTRGPRARFHRPRGGFGARTAHHERGE